MERIFNRIASSCFLILLLGVFLVSCRKENLVESVASNVNITTYLDQHPEKFSEFRKILTITNTADYLQAYGNYTLFLPTNSAVEKYLKNKGVSSLDQIPVEDLKNVVRFHLLNDTIATTRFGDGKLTVPTLLGQYLITGTSSVNNETSILINRQANLEVSNIRLGNGYVHVIDNVLEQSKYTLARLLEEPDSQTKRFSIFSEALKATGLYDSLNYQPATNPDTTKRYLTVIAETDAVLNSANIFSVDDLKSIYDNTDVKDLKDHRNGLHAWVAYHILYDAKYYADIAPYQAHKTLAVPEIITTEYINQQIIVNDVIFNNQHEVGFMLDRGQSDISASNGVLHIAAPYTSPKDGLKHNGHFAIKKREPFRVDWDIAETEDYMKHPNFRTGTAGFDFRKSSKTAPSPIKSWEWGNTIYGPAWNAGGAADPWYKGDFIKPGIGVSSRNDWMTVKTPLIVKGDYYVWINYRARNQSGKWPANKCIVRVSVDGVDLPTLWYSNEPCPVGSTAELASIGWKYYTSNGNPNAPYIKSVYDVAGTLQNNPWCGRNLGIITIQSTDTHTLRFDAVRGSQSETNIDMVQFIPVKAASQILPRFKSDGTEDWTDYPGTH